MSDTFNLANSIWPNGMKVDSDGHAVFYPLGTNKVQVPTSSSEWPKGNKLVSSFVFQDDKLVGFVDTKALIANDSKTTSFPYDYVNISLPSIAEGEMTYNYDQCTCFVLNGEVLKGEIPSDGDSDEDFFNILGGNYIYGDDLSTYGMFTCEEDAAAQMRLTPYVKPQTENH